MWFVRSFSCYFVKLNWYNCCEVCLLKILLYSVVDGRILKKGRCIVKGSDVYKFLEKDIISVFLLVYLRYYWLFKLILWVL